MIYVLSDRAAVVAAAVAGAFACHLESRQKAVKSGADGEYNEGGQSAGAADDGDEDAASGNQGGGSGNGDSVGASDVQIAIRSGRARRASAVQVNQTYSHCLERETRLVMSSRGSNDPTHSNSVSFHQTTT